MGCRDFTKTLWNASFRGVPFEVENESPKGGREQTTHKFLGAEHWINEDKGRTENKISFTAFVFGDNIEVLAEAVFQAFNAFDEPGLLILPHHSPRMASVNSCSSSFKMNELGYVTFDIEVTLESIFSPAPFLVNLSIGVIETAYLAVIPVVTAFLNRFLSLKNEGDHVVNAAIEEVQLAASVFLLMRQYLPLNENDNALAFQKTKDLAIGAPRLIQNQQAVGFKDLNLAQSVSSVINSFVDPLPPRHAFETLSRLLSNFEVYEAPASLLLSRHRAENAAKITRIAMVSLLFADLFYRLAKVEFTDRPSAELARQTTFAQFDNLLEQIEDNDLLNALLKVRDLVQEHLSQTLLNINGLLVLEAKESMPATFWAHRLYKDIGRIEELVQRNFAFHPSFMPHSFEVRAT